MNYDRLKYLLQQHQVNKCTKAEWEELNNWFLAYNPGKKDLEAWLEETGGAEELSAICYKDFNQRLNTISKHTLIRKIYRNSAAVAAVLAALAFFLYKYERSNTHLIARPTLAQHSPIADHIRTGSNKAILTLADGSKIPLDDTNKDTIAVQNNTDIRQMHGGRITYHPDGRPSNKNQLVYNKLSTPRGGKFSVTLADGTLATLDAESSITYPVAFDNDERRVEVTGQVFFEVVHKTRQPFRVMVKGQTVEDIGTSFNIKAYDDETSVGITLAEGRVKIINPLTTVTLAPGQQARIDNGRQDIHVKSVDVAEIISWKNGWFAFHHETIQNVMKQAARWYDVDVIYERVPVNREFGGMISKYKEISELLQNLKLAGGINYRIEGRKVIIY